MSPTASLPPDIASQSGELISQLQRNSQHMTLTIDDQTIDLSHLDKPIWSPRLEQPQKVDVTKRELLIYYLKAAPALLPFLADRPLTIKRYPEGVDGASFMQRHMDGLPEFVDTVEICTDATGNNEPFLLCNNLATLIWLINADTVELHPWHSRINPDDTGLPTIFINSTGTLEMSVLNYPDWLAFDIDPTEDDHADNGDHVDRAKEAAGLVHHYLDSLQLRHVMKLSGKRGVHIMVPLVRQYTFDQARQAVKRLSNHMADTHDDVFTTEWHKERRQGKVLLDWHQNARGKSLVAPFSARGSHHATISMPLIWEQLASAAPHDYTVEKATLLPHFFDTNPWHDLLANAQPLPTELVA